MINDQDGAVPWRHGVALFSVMCSCVLFLAGLRLGHDVIQSSGAFAYKGQYD